MQIKGINLKQNSRGEIVVGIHEETFKQFLASTPKTSAGYINFRLIPNHVPTNKGGYTHKAVLIEHKDKPAGEVLQ